MGIEQYYNDSDDRDELLFKAPETIQGGIDVTKKTYEDLVEMLANVPDPESRQAKEIRDLIDRTHGNLLDLEEKLKRSKAKLN